ncbi:MAG TPA: putative porin [Puia sp.]|nr:putative porin [Puia sp.]
MNKKISIIIFFLGVALSLHAQDDMASKFRNRGGGKGKDSTLQHRTGLEDSITINYRFLDSSRLKKLDSTIYDFTKKYPLPWNYTDLGNYGTPSHNLIFTPLMQTGWDPGFHSYDPYLFTVDETRFYNTTRPYTELGYLLGSKKEQYIGIIHTQNIKPNWNAAIQYRLISSSGTFQSQNTNHNNYRFSSWYQSLNKRYQAFLIFIGNKIQSADNGGLQNLADLDSITFTDHTTVPTNLGQGSPYADGPYSQAMLTGTKYQTTTYMLRQQYDIIGKKDSIVTDSTVIPLFYPFFRAEHTIQCSTYKYNFTDNDIDSAYYASHYNYTTSNSPYTINFSRDSFSKQDYWRQMLNDFSLYQFPEPKNPQQFIKIGATAEYLGGIFDSSSTSFYNFFLHGEYRNKTRNQKWDIEANGKFYLAGIYAANYSTYITLRRYISKQIGYLQVGFQNTNRTPSFAYDRASSFSFQSDQNFSKENITHLFASLDQPLHNFHLSGNYYLVNNYHYFTDYYKENQQSSPFNVLEITAEKKFIWHRHLIWRTSLTVQQQAGATPVHIPVMVTRNQFSYEGNFGYKNLDLSFGLDIRYYTGYKADNYSAPNGQFFIQNDTTIRQHLPDVTGYLNIRLRSFTAYIRAENLNTLQVGGSGGFGFNNFNYLAPNYPDKGLQIRFGFFWSFVN